MRVVTLPKNQKKGGIKSIALLNIPPTPKCNGCHPPRKTVAPSAAAMNIFINSARKFNTTVFSVESCGKLRFSFCDIEWTTICLSSTRNHKDYEGDECR